MYLFEATALWERTLAPQNEGDRAERARKRIRETFLAFRGRAETLASEIPQDLRLLTVHDISHIDALWEIADLIIGEDYEINPVEAFLLGGAFLLHDLGMSLSAYNEGIEEIRRHKDWGDVVTAIYSKKNGRKPIPEEIEKPDTNIEKEAKEQLLRNLHAKHAEILATCAFRHRSTDPQYHLIEDIDLRLDLGRLIGQTAYSHWWPIEKVAEQFDRRIGAPVFCPREWRIDPLKIACLIRVADACHLDSRRAPGFLKALRKPSGFSEEHWIFQEHLQKPDIEHERIIFSTGRPFPQDESRAWWLCFDTLQMADRELRDVDSLLRDTGRVPFEAKGIAGSDDPARLRKHIPTEGWEPVDVQIKVTDVATLVQKLGGWELYGEDPTVPLRELMQNAADAVRARRILEGIESGRGEITINLYKERDKEYIEVIDNGIGMSKEVLCGPFLDFGKSYWGSQLMIKEHPGLMQKGFDSTGQYGIGFYSVFMWGDNIEIITRSRHAGLSGTLILEFKDGLNERPILRLAEENEQLLDPGTIVRVLLRKPSTNRYGLLSGIKGNLDDYILDYFPDISYYPKELGLLCAWVNPASDVDIYVSVDKQKRRKAVEQNDWKTMQGELLIQRLWGKRLEKGTNEYNYCKDASKLLSIINDIEGNAVGRMAIEINKRAQNPNVTTFNIGMGDIGIVTAGTFRSFNIRNFHGLAIGKSKTVSRKSADPIISEESLATWASEQASLINKMDITPYQKGLSASIIRSIGGETCSLEIAFSSRGWLSFDNIININNWPDEIALIRYNNWYELINNNNDCELLPHVITYISGSGDPGIFGCKHKGKAEHRKWRLLNRNLEGAVIEALSISWGAKLQDVLEVSVFEDIESRILIPFARKADGTMVEGDGVLIRKPNI